VVVDANVERVVARLFAIAEPLPAARKAIREAAEAITPDQRAGDFAQAIMDLGARVCTVRTPTCLVCPILSQCRAKALGDPERFPAKPPKKPKPVRLGRAYWIERDGHVLLVRRPGKGMLGGMRALPDDGWNARGDGSGQPPLSGQWQSAGTVQHVFTHFALELQVLVSGCGECSDQDGECGEWWPVAQLEQAGLPTLFANAARLVMAQREDDG
jgi:A/G-specific adenine glycosylase